MHALRVTDFSLPVLPLFGKQNRMAADRTSACDKGGAFPLPFPGKITNSRGVTQEKVTDDDRKSFF